MQLRNGWICVLRLHLTHKDQLRPMQTSFSPGFSGVLRKIQLGCPKTILTRGLDSTGECLLSCRENMNWRTPFALLALAAVSIAGLRCASVCRATFTLTFTVNV